MLTRWTDEETATLHRMMEQGNTRDEIAKELGCDTGRIRKKIWDMSRTVEQRRNCASRRRERDERKTERHEVRTESRPDEALLAEAAIRAAAPRSLSAMLLGDPPKGYSALDRRGAL
jgi:hypothetical protein